MCGRYLCEEDSANEIVLSILSDLKDRGIQVKTGTVVPGDTAAVLASSKDLKPKAFPMFWGYRLADGRLLFNARSETASKKKIFSDGFDQRRCLIPADMYFEWEKTPSGKQKYSIGPRNSRGFYLAGIYRLTHGAPEFSILTRNASESISFIHDRMPVILPHDMVKDWLNPSQSAAEMLSYVLTDMEYTKEVSSSINIQTTLFA